MSNGRPWTAHAEATLRRYAGREADAAIGRRTGHAEITIRKRREDAGLPSYVGRPYWSRRDALLNSAAGLDFQISDCRT